MKLISRLGPGVWLALPMLLAAALLAAWLAPAWQREADALTQQRRANAPRSPLPAHEPALPPPEQARQRLATLLELAERHGVQVQRTDQRLARQAGAEHLALAMPVVARYADLRAWLQAALQADPALSLDSVRLRRDGPDAVSLQAELAWALHQQPGPSP